MMLMETMELARNHENSANHAKNQMAEKKRVSICACSLPIPRNGSSKMKGYPKMLLKTNGRSWSILGSPTMLNKNKPLIDPNPRC